ncbi:MAG: class I SAM-dependent methyltransferase [Tannerellaceae bacterium]|nr:class I SAM-dependent methyltransferase [Tannerellaceae bacterium]
MERSFPQKELYAKERFTAVQAQRLAQEIAFGPVVFHVSRLMIKFGLFEMLRAATDGMTLEEISEKSGFPRYAVQVLLESSLTTGTVLLKDDRFYLAKAGWFLLTDRMARVNMDFNHHVNYIGLFRLEEALLNGKPEGLDTFGNWATIYEGLSALPEHVQKSWFSFDHFYSDNSFRQALDIVFARPVRTLLDVGGNTGRWALQCVAHSKEVEITVMDLPGQLKIMREHTKGKEGDDRIHEYPADLLNDHVTFPAPFDVVWMSQFLDCFSEDETLHILSAAARSMGSETRLYIMETFWDRQRFETAAYCLTQISLYFTAMANGKSKMYHSGDMERLVKQAGLTVEAVHDGLGLGHSIIQCKRT